MSKRRWLIGAVVVLVFAGGMAVGATVLGGSSSAAAVTLEPATSTGAHPFTSSVASGAIAISAKAHVVTVAKRRTLSTNAATHTLFATGTAPGLYGGSGNPNLCDPRQLVAFVQQIPDKATAWAGVLGIEPSKIENYVATLTPVLLTDDTLVTNHGYLNGRVTTLQSVLQAGTTVMVDAHGVPRVKCASGNPLTSPALVNPAHYNGTAWRGYSPTEVTVVRSGPTMGAITLINIKTGKTYQQAVGPNQPIGKRKPVGTKTPSSNTNSGEFVAAVPNTTSSQTAIYASPDGGTWTSAGVIPSASVSALAWGNGKWLAFGASRTSGTTVFESSDLRVWSAVQHVPDYLADATYNNGRWIAVGWVNVSGTSSDPLAGEFPPAAAYASQDGVTWTRVASIANASPFDSVAYEGNRWVAVGINLHQGDVPSSIYASPDGSTWTKQADASLNSSVSQALIGFGSGQWALGGLDISPAKLAGGPESGVVAISPDATNWTFPPGGHFPGDPISGIAYGNSEWLVTGGRGDVFASPDGNAWAKRAPLAGTATLAFGGTTTSSTTAPAVTTPPSTISPPTTAPSTSQPVAAAASSLRSIPWQNYMYKDLVCGTGKLVKFTNSEWSPPRPAGSLGGCGMAFVAVNYADVTGDGVEDAIVNLDGSASGGNGGEQSWTVVFTSGPGGPVSHGYIDGPSFPPYSASGGITTWISDFASGDPLCCPSQYVNVTYKFSASTGTFVKVATTHVPGSALPQR